MVGPGSAAVGVTGPADASAVPGNGRLDIEFLGLWGIGSGGVLVEKVLEKRGY